MKLNIEWVVESDSSIYTTPIVDRIYGHRNKHLLSTTFSNYLEVIDQHGQRPPIGWPIEFNDKSEVILQFGGGCQGCGMIDVTLKHGIEKTLVDQLPEITAVKDITDHSQNENAYYSE